MSTKQVARLRYLRMAPRKVQLVAHLVRGLSVNEAEAQLLHEPRRAAKPLLKLLRSAVASAKLNNKLDPQKLFIEGFLVDQGPMLKRSLPRARGMATPIHKKMSHVTLVLAERRGAGPARFKIVVTKKVKLPEEEGKQERKKKQIETASSRPSEKKPGFFKKFFQRKSV